MSQNICTLVDLFDKAVAEGVRPNTVKTRSEPYYETEKYSQPVTYIGTQPHQHRFSWQARLPTNYCFQDKYVVRGSH